MWFRIYSVPQPTVYNCKNQGFWFEVKILALNCKQIAFLVLLYMLRGCENGSFQYWEKH